jgi:amino acid adenylation domain-containing protein
MANASELGARLTSLSPEKRALLQRKLLEKRAAEAGARAVRPRQRGGPCPLSFSQELMWLLDQLNPGVSAYNVPRVFRVEGDLDVAALGRALGEVVRRHEILRTTYAAVGGEPAQVVCPHRPVPLDVTDLGGLAPDRREAEVRRLAAEMSDRGFDLSRDLLLRTALLRLAPREHVLILVSHHIASDGGSKAILFRELEALYGAFREGRPSPLPEPPLQYADFAVWQRENFRGEVYDKLLDYWKRQLAGAPPLLELPTDRPRPAVQSGRGRRLMTRLPGALAEGLKALGRQEGATLFMTCLAAFQVLLHRYSRQDDFVIGTPTSGRTRTEVEGIVGYFSNSLALRANLAGDLTFRELLRRVRATTLDAFSHQEMPFEKLITELNPERTLSYSPVYQVMFSVGSGQTEDLHLPGLALTTLLADRQTSKFDLALGLRDSGGDLRVGFEYSLDLFDPATIERLLGHYHVLLDAVIARPDERLSRLPMLTPAEERRVLIEWNSTARDGYPLHTPLHRLFEAQAARTPDAEAVVADDGRLTYRELNERANRVAHFLRRAGAGRGTFVAVLLERGADFVTAVLAAFKAGAAYIPVDPNYPPDRVRLLLSDSEAPVVLTRAATLGRHPGLLDQCPALRTVLCLDRLPDGLPADDPANVNGPADLIYMIYTSGSTGTPKGALIRHDGAVNHIYAQLEALGLGGDFAFLQSAPSSSDISVWQFLAPLLTGGRTVVAGDETILDPARLFRMIRDNRCTIIELVPVLWKALMDHAAGLPEAERALPGLRWMMVTGETAPVELVNAWFRLYPGVRVANAYGPTEAADDVVQHVLDGPLPPGQSSVPIGKPLANLNAFILDRHLRPCPVGVPGEICISGVGVGEGYWKNEERTRQSFVPNPFPGTLGKTLYRTGDLGRWLADGTVEYLGRIDQQVKVRGFRIELGEVEAALLRHPAVAEAVVLAREDRPGDRRLVAYVVPRPEHASVNGELRLFLKDNLPAHMVPSAFLVLPRLPLAPSGKVDRRALPAPEEAPAEDTYVAPRTPVEELLAGIWAEVLKVERVGVHDNFFELGGHSLMATQVVSRVREALQINLGLRQLFEAPTIAELVVPVVQQLAEQAPEGELV